MILELKNKENQSEIKQCIYDRKSFCREDISCVVFHTEEICKDLVEKEGKIFPEEIL